MMASIAAFFQAVAAICGWGKARSDLNNTPEMKARKKAQQDADRDADNVRIIKEKNIEDARKKLAP